LPAPFELALVEDAYGRYLRRAGERRAAAELLGRARDTYVRLGARPFLEPIERELQGCGLTPTRRRSPDPTRLTPQELAVARLVATGLTNREVAAELVVSVKTVEYHLGHVYQKLGVRSRTELAGQFAASGVPEGSPGSD
jgi:DNA-binding NarL/FixJ family response regulator